jgi:hypothetical protein
VLGSALENAALTAEAADVGLFTDGPVLTLGIDEIAEGEWTWALYGTAFWSGGAAGAPVDGAFTAWQGGAPSEDSGVNCLGLTEEGQWLPIRCDLPHAFICEVP